MTNIEGTRSIIIAEAGINHDGDLQKAKKMVKIAAEAGADYVKFQSFKADKLVTKDALTSSYIDEGSHKGESFRDLLRRLELDANDHLELKKYCDELGIKFLSTAFDQESFDFLVELGADVVKIASGDVTNIPLIKYFARSNLPIIMSTGMATLGEIESAIEAIEAEGNKQITLLHCVSWYPAEISTTNLNYMNTLRSAFNYPVGYSDHTLGITMTVAARAMGATVIEKHFTIDKNDFGPDHAASIDAAELHNLIKSVREVEEGLGSSRRTFGEKELGQRNVHRRSIVASRPISEGQIVTMEDLTIKRPGTGIKPQDIDDVVGRKAKNDIEGDSVITWSSLERRFA